MGFNNVQQVSEVPNYLIPFVGLDGEWGSVGGLALQDSLARGSAEGVMDLLKSMDERGVVCALREAGFSIDPSAIGRGRATVFESIKNDLAEAIELRLNGFELSDARAMASDRIDLIPQPFAAKGMYSNSEDVDLDFSAAEFAGNIDAARVIQGLMRSPLVSVHLLGDVELADRGVLMLVASQALQKGLQGFGFDGIEGKYQVPFSLSEIVDLHQAAAQAVALESARTGLAEWVAGDKVSALSEWVPDSVQRLLHGSVSLAAAQAVVAVIEGDGIKRHAGEIGVHAITGLLAAQGLKVDALTIGEQAAELNLTMKEPDRNRGQYFGPVVALDHKAALIKITRKDAIELPFMALAPGQDRPNIGDNVRMGFKAGELSISVAERIGRANVGR